MKTYILKSFSEWAEKIGRREALKRLINRDVPVSTAEKLVGGRYPGRPRTRLMTILIDEMAKDEFVMPDKAAGQN